MWLKGKLKLSEDRLYTEELVDYLGTQAELLGSTTIQRRALERLRAQSPNAFAAVVQSSRKTASGPIQKMKALVKNLAGMNATAASAPEDAVPFVVKVSESSKSSMLESRLRVPSRRARGLT